MVRCKLPETHNPEKSGCEACTKEWKREHYRLNRDRYLLEKRAYDKKLREQNRALIRKTKNTPCADCGITYPWYVMDFDHISDDKEYAVSRMISKTNKLVQKEIDKCEVVCSNCHRERTHQRQRSSVV